MRWQSRARITAQAQAGLEQERPRIAADMHDLVAHTWAVVAAQADGARYALGNGAADRKAEEALEVIAETARGSIADLRDLLAELRYQEPATPPGPASREALVERMRASGMDVRLVEHGDPSASGLLAVTAQRLLAESLTNALKHGDLAPGRGRGGLARRLPSGRAQPGARPRSGRPRQGPRPRGDAGPGAMAGGTFDGGTDGDVDGPRRAAGAGRVTVRVALVDDQAMFRAGIAMVVDSQPDLEVVGQADDGDQVPGLVEKAQPDVVVMDVRMARVDGVTATRLLHDRLGEAAPRVLVLTTFDLDEAAVSAIEAGASGFVLKDARPELLLAAIRAVADGSQVVAAGATRSLLERFRATRTGPGAEYAELTPREREILLRAAGGLSNAEIAAVEHLSEATVKTHVSRILAKLGLRDRVQLVVYAYEHGLL